MGIYTISNIQFSEDSKLNNINNMLIIYSNMNSYPLPELNMLTSLGVKFDIIYGAYGSTFDCRFTEDMIKSKDEIDGVPFYSRYVGACSIRSDSTSSNFHCSIELAWTYARYLSVQGNNTNNIEF